MARSGRNASGRGAASVAIQIGRLLRRRQRRPRAGRDRSAYWRDCSATWRDRAGTRRAAAAASARQSSTASCAAASAASRRPRSRQPVGEIVQRHGEIGPERVGPLPPPARDTDAAASCAAASAASRRPRSHSMTARLFSDIARPGRERVGAQPPPARDHGFLPPLAPPPAPPPARQVRSKLVAPDCSATSRDRAVNTSGHFAASARYRSAASRAADSAASRSAKLRLAVTARLFIHAAWRKNECAGQSAARAASPARSGRWASALARAVRVFAAAVPLRSPSRRTDHRSAVPGDPARSRSHARPALCMQALCMILRGADYRADHGCPARRKAARRPRPGA